MHLTQPQITSDFTSLAQRPVVQNASMRIVLADERVWHLHGERLDLALRPSLALFIPSGEQHKTLATCTKLWDEFYNYRVDRHAVVYVIGGGMSTDLGGFVAASWKRGLPFVLIPTTLLAMVDAALGGKLGVDYRGGKNLVGTFAQPEAILIDPAFLQTLPTRELAAGMAEAIKHAALDGAEHWQLLQAWPQPEQWPQADWPALLTRSTQTKLRIAGEDPYERGLRKTLNLGHTLGHAIEAAALVTSAPLLHGEAVALGLLGEAYLAEELLGLPEEDTMALQTTLTRQGLLQHLPALDWPTLWQHMLQDKKNSGGSVRLALLERLGKAVWDVPATEEQLRAAWQRLSTSLV